MKFYFNKKIRAIFGVLFLEKCDIILVSRRNHFFYIYNFCEGNYAKNTMLTNMILVIKNSYMQRIENIILLTLNISKKNIEKKPKTSLNASQSK